MLQWSAAGFLIVPRSTNMHCSDWCISRQLWWGHQIPAYCVLFSSKHSDTVCICCLFLLSFY